MKVIFFNRFFFPDTSATSQILSDLAFDLAKSGHDVHVVTCRVPGGSSPLEKRDGVTIHRVAGASTVPHGLFRRGAAYLRYYLGARRLASRLIGPGDVTILKTDPPLLSAVIGPLAIRRKSKLVLWVQDVFPEVAAEFGVPGFKGPIGRTLRELRNRSLATADRVIVICDRMAAVLRRAACVEADRLQVIHNWANGREIIPLDHVQNDLRREWNLEDAFVVGYSGNLGRVHEFDTILGAARRLIPEAGIRFLIIGRGPRLDEVRSSVVREGLRNVRFEPHQDRSALGKSLCVPDVHVSVLRPEFEGLVHPSKLYGIMAAGRPTIFIGDPEGETAAILASAGAGLSVRQGDSAGLAHAILHMRKDKDGRRQMGIRARQAFDEKFDSTIALDSWRRLIASLEG